MGKPQIKQHNNSRLKVKDGCLFYKYTIPTEHRSNIHKLLSRLP